MESKRRLTGLDVACGIACVGVLLLFIGLFASPFGDDGDRFYRKARCASNLTRIAQAMNMYLLKYGEGTHYSVPGDTFRGDEWLVTLYWTGIINEPTRFACLRLADRAPLPAKPPAAWGDAATIPDGALDYAGRCRGLTGRHAYRNTTCDFTEPNLGSASILACDKPGNHDDGLTVVYFDAHVEFWPHLGDQVGRPDAVGKVESPPDLNVGQLRYTDPGEP